VSNYGFYGGSFAYEDTVEFDQKNPDKNYASNWCQDARDQGYIFIWLTLLDLVY
jgi:hypothetical protein